MPYRTLQPVSFLQDMLQNVAEHGRGLVARAFGSSVTRSVMGQGLGDVAQALLERRGEASRLVLAKDIMDRYAAMPEPARRAALEALLMRFGPDQAAIRKAWERYEAEPVPANLRALNAAVEPPRQELIRRLNLAPGNTLKLVRMREDLLDALGDKPHLADADADFQHLFSSWFNRGFLVMRRIDWATPANILEKIIKYEAVHAIESWEDLRRRIEPPDRRCFAFFHPALGDEPLIFVEVALTTGIPGAIQSILSPDRPLGHLDEADTAVFYSISNCQRGLSRISFGNFLIKQVAEELSRELPRLKTFVTLSPVPGFRRWATGDGQVSPHLTEVEREQIMRLDKGAELTAADISAAAPTLRKALAAYLLRAKSRSGLPVDPVERFHLGNGARLEKIHPTADLSRKGRKEGFGAMVNYLYDLPMVEAYHERYAEHGDIALSPELKLEFSGLAAKPAP
jgi:malonyl-CoA decarboxylase